MMSEEQISTIMWLFTVASLTPEQMAERDRLIAGIEKLRKKVNGEKERYR